MSEIPPIHQPPGYSNYPRFTPGGPSYQRPPGVYFDCIGEAWTLVQKNLGTWILTTLICGALYYGTIIAVEFGFFFLAAGIAGTTPGGATAPSMTLILLLIPVLLIVVCIFQVIFAGLMKMGVKQARGEPIAIGDAFSCFPNTITIVVSMLLSGLAIAIGSCLCFVPGFWLSGIFAFVPMLAADKNLGPIEVLQVSYDTLKPYAWPLFALHLVASLIGGAGAFLCGIGMIVTYPIFVSIMGLSYNNFFPSQPQGNFVYNQPIGFEPPR
jgi:hypothetical protein